MKTFHITWATENGCTSGKNYEAKNMGEAYIKFVDEYGIEPIYIIQKS